MTYYKGKRYRQDRMKTEATWSKALDDKEGKEARIY